MKVYLAAFGSGMGHASRMAALADELSSSGDKVMFSSSGEVTAWLNNRGFGCNDLPLVDVAFTEEGNFSATKTLNFFPVTLKRMLEQVQLEVGNIKRFAPEVVLSDSVASTLVASKLLGIGSVAVLNQLRLMSSPRTPWPAAMALTGASVAVGSVFWGLCREILIPDLPPPYTISERNLWNAGKSSARAQYIGFLTPRRPPLAGSGELPADWLAEKRRPRVFWQISGPKATRTPFLAKALEIARELQDDYVFAITAGNPRGEITPVPVPGGHLYQWCPNPGAFLETSDAVVSRAGHVSISDYILRAKPSILVPIRAQTEQMGNAAKARRLGISITLEETALDPAVVRASLRELRGQSYATRAQEMKRVAEGYDAVTSIIEALKQARAGA